MIVNYTHAHNLESSIGLRSSACYSNFLLSFHFIAYENGNDVQTWKATFASYRKSSPKEYQRFIIQNSSILAHIIFIHFNQAAAMVLGVRIFTRGMAIFLDFQTQNNNNNGYLRDDLDDIDATETTDRGLSSPVVGVEASRKLHQIILDGVIFDLIAD